MMPEATTKYSSSTFNKNMHRGKGFICSICQKAFARKDTLKLHIWNKHTEKLDALSQQTKYDRRLSFPSDVETFLHFKCR